MQASGPRPPVKSCNRSKTYSSLMSIVSAPAARLIANRSGTSSMLTTRSAPSMNALRMANCPTGPAPQTATTSPPFRSQFSAAW